MFIHASVLFDPTNPSELEMLLINISQNLHDYKTFRVYEEKRYRQGTEVALVLVEVSVCSDCNILRDL